MSRRFALDSCSSEECCLPGVRFDGRTAPGEAEALGDSCPQIRVHPPPQRDGALLHLALYSIGHVTDDVAHEVIAIGHGGNPGVGRGDRRLLCLRIVVVAHLWFSLSASYLVTVINGSDDDAPAHAARIIPFWQEREKAWAAAVTRRCAFLRILRRCPPPRPPTSSKEPRAGLGRAPAMARRRR